MSQHRALWIGGILIVFVRLLLVVGYPFAFGHYDSVNYLQAVHRMIGGGSFVPEPIRPMGLYAFFVYGIYTFLSKASIWIPILQHLLTLVSAGIGFWIVHTLTKRFYPSLITLLLIGLSPRTLLYGQLVLVDSLYTSGVILFFGALLFLLKRPGYFSASLLGLSTSFLILGRGQGILALAFGFLVLIYQRSWRLLPLFAVTALTLPMFYNYSNYKHHGFFGSSVSANHNLFWVASAHLLNFSSAKHSDIKEKLKECVTYSNENAEVIRNWALYGPKCSNDIIAIETSLWPNWKRYNQVCGELAYEAILTHPISFTYKFLRSLPEFFLYKTTLFKTIDLGPFIF